MPLVLTLKDHDTVVIGDGLILVKLCQRRRNKIQLVIDAPPEIPVDRLAVFERKRLKAKSRPTPG